MPHQIRDRLAQPGAHCASSQPCSWSISGASQLKSFVRSWTRHRAKQADSGSLKRLRERHNDYEGESSCLHALRTTTKVDGPRARGAMPSPPTPSPLRDPSPRWRGRCGAALATLNSPVPYLDRVAAKKAAVTKPEPVAAKKAAVKKAAVRTAPRKSAPAKAAKAPGTMPHRRHQIH